MTTTDDNTTAAYRSSRTEAATALANLIAATDALTTTRMPSRAEWEAAKAGLLALVENGDAA